MPAAVRLGDQCTGDGCFPPRVNDEASENVFINGIGAHRQGDHWITHCCTIICHDGTLQTGSATVFINGKAAARIGDPITCGAAAAVGSPNVFFGG
jgi:uncharacterized Zn-binding protein involved in type VI secretion